MAFRYFARKTDANKLVRAIENETSASITVWRDGKSWRVQCNELGNEQMDVLMERAGVFTADA